MGIISEKNHCSSFSITFDSWTDIGRKNSYVAVTCHWYCDGLFDWSLHSAVFDVIPFKRSHTAEQQLALQIGYHLQDCPNHLLYCGVTDNAANVTKACNLILNGFSENN